jgi:hypothetical protein
VGTLKRELAKAAVEQRALEREVARVRAHAEALDRTKFEYLEEKLRAKEGQVLTLRSERNALLSSLRQLQQAREDGTVERGTARASGGSEPRTEALSHPGPEPELEAQPYSSPAPAAPNHQTTTPRTAPGERRVPAGHSAAAAAAEASGAGEGADDAQRGRSHALAVSADVLDELQELSQQLLTSGATLGPWGKG